MSKPPHGYRQLPPGSIEPPPDPDAELGELIGACLLAAVCLAIAFAIAVIGSRS